MQIHLDSPHKSVWVKWFSPFLKQSRERILCWVILTKAVRSSRPEVFCKKGVLRNFAKFLGKLLYQSLFFNKVADLRPATLIKKETLARVFSCESCEISKNTFSCRTRLVAASELIRKRFSISINFNNLKCQKP